MIAAWILGWLVCVYLSTVFVQSTHAGRFGSMDWPPLGVVCLAGGPLALPGALLLWLMFGRHPLLWTLRTKPLTSKGIRKMPFAAVAGMGTVSAMSAAQALANAMNALMAKHYKRLGLITPPQTPPLPTTFHMRLEIMAGATRLADWSGPVQSGLTMQISLVAQFTGTYTHTESFMLSGNRWLSCGQVPLVINTSAIKAGDTFAIAYTVTLPGTPPAQSSRKAKDDPNAHLGFRAWIWDVDKGELRSPQQNTVWHDAELHCARWDGGAAVQGAAGIHARPYREDWTRCISPDFPHGASMVASYDNAGKFRVSPVVYVTGVVERYGKFVQGTDGWRAEWVRIRELLAPTTEIGLQLEKAFPDVTVRYD